MATFFGFQIPFTAKKKQTTKKVVEKYKVEDLSHLSGHEIAQIMKERNIIKDMEIKAKENLAKDEKIIIYKISNNSKSDILR